MAFFPCSRGHTNPRGKNINWYIAVGSGTEFVRSALRLCPAHARDVQDYLAERELVPVNATDGVGGSSTECLTCGEVVAERGRQVFLTGYPAQDQREDYWSQLHDNCVLPKVLSSQLGPPL
jgi:hypothetical protein